MRFQHILTVAKKQCINAFFFTLFLGIFVTTAVYAAISWPATPSGETAGGKIASVLNAMLSSGDWKNPWTGKVKSAAVVDDNPQIISVQMYSATPTGRNAALSMNAWNNIATKWGSWPTSINSAPSLYSSDGFGTVTVTQGGVYEIQQTGIYQPASTAYETAYYCPLLNGSSAVCSGDHTSHGYHPAWVWAKTTATNYVNISANTTISFGLYPISAYNYWGYDNLMTLTIKRIH